MVLTPRYFTPASATTTLVYVKRVVADALRHSSRLADLLELLDNVERTGDEAKLQELEMFFSIIAARLRTCVDELEQVGADLVDADRGVVDFACMNDGVEARLCWQYGEREVAYWHEVDQCGHQRLPVSTLKSEPAFASAG